MFGQRMQHLIGISETVQNASHPITDSLPAGSRSKAQHEVPYRAAAADIVGHSMSDESGVGSGSESSSVIGGLDTFKVHMDTTLPTLQIERCRRSFSNTTGMNLGDKFNDILPESHRVMFTSWIEEMFTRSESRLPAASLDVVLLPQGLKRFGLRIKAVASIANNIGSGSFKDIFRSKEIHAVTGLSATPQMQKCQFESEIFGAEFVPVNLDNVECIKQSGHVDDGVLIWR